MRSHPDVQVGRTDGILVKLGKYVSLRSWKVQYLGISEKKGPRMESRDINLLLEGGARAISVMLECFADVQYKTEKVVIAKKLDMKQ